MPRLALVGLCVLALSGVAAAQGGMPNGGLPANCTQVEGGFEVTATTMDTVDITLTGDVAGTLTGTIDESNDVTFGFGTISVIHFTGTVTGATGTLEVSGRLLVVTLGTSMPGGGSSSGGMPMGSLTLLKLLVTGGTGDYDGQTGIVVGFDSDFGMAMPWMSDGYHGVLCTPAAPPMP